MRVRYALLLCALLLGSSLHLWGQKADGSELYPRQHYNYSLYGCGDELLLSSANMRVANRGEAHFELSERGGVPSVVMNIHSERKGRLFGFQKFIVVQPSTGYSVRYEVEALRTTTPAPLRLVATLYDDAREVIATISHTLDGVGEGAFDFTTHPLTRCAKIALHHTTDESQVEGVVPEDDGVRVEWFRRWDRLPQGVSIRNEYIHDNKGVGCGRATVQCRVPQVEGAVVLVVRSPQPQGDAPTIALLTVGRDY